MTTLTTTLTTADLAGIRGPLADANAAFAASHPGEPEDRQPAHTVYGGAQLYKHSTTNRMGELALRSLEIYAPDATTLANALGWSGKVRVLAPGVFEGGVAKLKREAVEDFRIDFEDGYGNRPDAHEDEEAARCAGEVAKGMRVKSLPAFIGIRVKTLSEEMATRALRTLDIFLSTLLAETDGKLPDGFVVTLPKILSAAHVTAFCDALDCIEAGTGLPIGTIKLELMIETPQSVLGDDGRVILPELVKAARGRCRGAHLGTYDYTALIGITAQHQVMAHPGLDFAKNMMQVSLAQRG
ncbi:MAG: phosphoenolpyruvate kinase, partial [Thermoleophilia bacterium]|nr:phosphoenolpyruvate kinase [Thermoleophilia bacterium]